MKDDNSKIGTDILRRKAEAIKKKQANNINPLLAEADNMKIIHELEVHQIELEMLNDELRQSNKQAFIATDKYIEMYDFAATSFVTVSKTGKIEKINLRGSNMLGKERALLFFCTFDLFVSDDTKPVFKDFIENIFTNKNRDTCYVTIQAGTNPPIDVQIDAVISENGKECYMSVTDITELKKKLKK